MRLFQGSGTLHSKAMCCYGYYEVEAKPMNSGGSSSFWFYLSGGTPGGTEIDVFEIGGKAKGFEYKYNMTLHVTEMPAGKYTLSVGVVDDVVSSSSVVKLAIKGRMEDGWYPISKVQIVH
jgi:hypothetical protein